MNKSIVKVFFIHSSFPSLFKVIHFSYDPSLAPLDYSSLAYESLGIQIPDDDFNVMYFWSCFSPYFRALDFETEIKSEISELAPKDDQTEKFHFFLMPSSQETELVPFHFVNSLGEIEWSVLSLNQTVRDFETMNYSAITNINNPGQSRLARLTPFVCSDENDEKEVLLCSFGEDACLSDCSLKKGALIYWTIDPQALAQLDQFNLKDVDEAIQTANIFYTTQETNELNISPELAEMLCFNNNDDEYLQPNYSLPILSQPSPLPEKVEPPQPVLSTPLPPPEEVSHSTRSTRTIRKTSVTRPASKKQTLQYLSGGITKKNHNKSHLLTNMKENSSNPSHPLHSIINENENDNEIQLIQHQTIKAPKKTQSQSQISSAPKITEFYFLPTPQKKISEAQVITLTYKSNSSSNKQINQLLTTEQTITHQNQNKSMLFDIPQTLKSKKGYQSTKTPHYFEQPLLDKTTLEFLKQNNQLKTFSQVIKDWKSFNPKENKTDNNYSRLEAACRSFVFESSEHKKLEIPKQVYSYVDRALTFETFLIDMLTPNSHFRNYLNDPSNKFPTLPSTINVDFFKDFVRNTNKDIQAIGINLFVLYFEYMIFQGGFLTMLNQIVQKVPSLLTNLYEPHYKKQGYSLMDFYTILFQLNLNQFDSNLLSSVLGDKLMEFCDAVKTTYFCDVQEFHIVLLWFREAPKAFNSWSMSATNQYFLYHNNTQPSDEELKWIHLLYKQVHIVAARKFLRLQFYRIFSGATTKPILIKRFQTVETNFLKLSQQQKNQLYNNKH